MIDFLDFHLSLFIISHYFLTDGFEKKRRLGVVFIPRPAVHFADSGYEH